MNTINRELPQVNNEAIGYLEGVGKFVQSNSIDDYV